MQYPSGKSEDFRHIEKCFTEIKQKESVDSNLSRISTALNRMFDIKFNISIVENKTNRFFGMSIYPTKNIIDSMVNSIINEKSSESIIVELWQKNKEWFLEIDSILLYDKNLNANPTEITAVLLHEIGHIVASNEIPMRINRIIRFKFTEMDYKLRRLCQNTKLQQLFNLVIVDACGDKNYHYVNLKSERIADKFVEKIGYSDELNNFITKLISTSGNSLVNKGDYDVENNIRIMVNWSLENISELEFRRNKLKQTLRTEILKNPSFFVKSIIDNIRLTFFGQDNNQVLESMEEMTLLNIKKKILTESVVTWFNDIGKIKKVSQSDIDIIGMEVDKITNTDDKIYCLDLIYEKLELIDTALSYLANNQADRVVQSKQTLITMKTQLEKMRERILALQIKEKQYGVFIKYPKGYEG